MKLSKAQSKVIEEAKNDINEARMLDYPEWLKEANPFYQCETEYHQKCFKEAVKRGEMKDYWQAHRDGMAITHCNSRTLYKLESLGLIEILEDSKGESYGLDWIKVLNY